MAQRYSIKNGPGKFDLMLALFEGRQIEFSYDEGDGITYSRFRRVIVTISGLALEEGSRNGWCLEGYVESSRVRFSGYYDLRTRTGWIALD